MSATIDQTTYNAKTPVIGPGQMIDCPKCGEEYAIQYIVVGDQSVCHMCRNKADNQSDWRKYYGRQSVGWEFNV